MALERQYKVEPSTRRCGRCDRPFAVGDEYYSAVVETDDESLLVRQDFCPACWTPDESYFSFWKTRVPEPRTEDRGPRLIDLGRLMELFERLAGAEEERARQFRYVLALVLMRKRRLKLVSSRRLPGGGGEEMTLRQAGSERTYTVSSPLLTEAGVVEIADRLKEILDMPERWEDLDAEAD